MSQCRKLIFLLPLVTETFVQNLPASALRLHKPVKVYRHLKAVLLTRISEQPGPNVSVSMQHFDIGSRTIIK